MTQGNRFCTNCGAALTPADHFCSSCGKPLASPAAAPTAPVYAPPPPPVNDETLIGIIPAVTRKKNMMAMEGFNIIVTRRRMIFAVMTNDMISRAAKQAGKEGGFLSGMVNAATAGYTFYKRYLTMPPDEALAENPQNFAVELSQVRKIKITGEKEVDDYFTMKANQNSILQTHQYREGTISFETTAGNYTFNVPPGSMKMALETVKKTGLY
jgi:zinc-ribbon domain